jgi:hypothetical protein
VFRPTPSGFEYAPAKGVIADCDNLKLSFSILEWARFVRLVKRFAFHLCSHNYLHEFVAINQAGFLPTNPDLT